MRHVLSSIPQAFGVILRDPINLFLAIIPTLIALTLYISSILGIYYNTDRFVALFKDYIYTADQANLLAKILTAILVIFVFFVMSWTFVIVVGIIAAPFNSMLSARIEKQLLHQLLPSSRHETMQKISQGLLQTFKNELKKLIFILLVTGLAFILNLFPLLYPLGIFLISTMLAVQFIDYSWSRHNMSFGECLSDILSNLFSYSIPGFVFLLLVTIPLVNALIPALATSYFTILWIHRRHKLP